jgi:hypothetical protein
MLVLPEMLIKMKEQSKMMRNMKILLEKMPKWKQINMTRIAKKRTGIMRLNKNELNLKLPFKRSLAHLKWLRRFTPLLLMRTN